MYKSIIEARTWSHWAYNSARYQRLEILDSLLDGYFYNHLMYDFEQESTRGDEYIPISKRIPSVQFQLPNQVAVRSARKLFAGRNRPHLVHTDPKLVSALLSIMHEGFLDSRLLKTAVDGSVGSAVMLFRILPSGDGSKRIIFETHRSKWCQPRFDPLGELKDLRINYTTSGQSLLMCGFEADYMGESLDPSKKYWFIKNLDINQEITYNPILEVEYDPFDPADKNKLSIFNERTYDYGFVPAHWFVNLAGGDMPDGACTWEAAIPISIHLDYTLSQLGRGLWYNAAPQLVVQGELKNYVVNDKGQTIVRGPATQLHFDMPEKNPNGTYGGGDAHLLEMAGTGLTASLNYVETLRKYALESIQLSRKDPDKMGSAPLSGKAMELLEDDFVDLLQELRTSYGEMGFLPILKKAVVAAEKEGHAVMKGVSLKSLNELTLQWPKQFALSSDELLKFSQAIIAMATTPLMPTVATHKPPNVSAGPSTGSSANGKSKPKPKGKPIDPHDPIPASVPLPEDTPVLLKPEEARALLETYVDIHEREEITVNQQEPQNSDDPSTPVPEVA